MKLTGTLLYSTVSYSGCCTWHAQPLAVSLAVAHGPAMAIQHVLLLYKVAQSEGSTFQEQVALLPSPTLLCRRGLIWHNNSVIVQIEGSDVHAELLVQNLAEWEVDHIVEPCGPSHVVVLKVNGEDGARVNHAWPHSGARARLEVGVDCVEP